MAKFEIEYALFPGHVPKPQGAQYIVSNRGHVFRDLNKDSTATTWIYDEMVIPFERGRAMNVKLSGGNQTLSLPGAVAKAFATRPHPDDDRRWHAVIVPGTPKDKITGVRRCGIYDVAWTPYSEYCRWANSSAVEPATLIPIVDP